MILRKALLIILIPAGLVLQACAGKAPARDFDSSRPVQTIALNGKQHIYAQDDVLLRHDSLFGKLSDMNPDWKTRIDRADTYQNLATASFVAELASLFVCLLQDTTGSALAWCGGTLGLAALSVTFEFKAAPMRYDVVNDFNQGMGRM